MTEEILISLALIIILGIFGQWVGWRIRLPAILILLLFGLIAGPITGLIHRTRSWAIWFSQSFPFQSP